jgi:hypothetical protein
MRRKALLVSILIGSGCGILGLDGTTTKELEVAPYKAGCTGMGPMLCLQVREPGETEFRNMFETPAGFQYEWGFEYLISVDEVQVDNPPADGSSISRRLGSVLSKTPVPPGSTFQLLAAPEGFQPIGDSRYLLFHGPEEIECSPGPRCTGLATSIADGVRALLLLRYPPTPGEPFQVVDWMACNSLFGPCVSPWLLASGAT